MINTCEDQIVIDFFPADEMSVEELMKKYSGAYDSDFEMPESESEVSSSEEEEESEDAESDDAETNEGSNMFMAVMFCHKNVHYS